MGAAPDGEWSGHAGELAAREGGNWLFFAPREGLRVFDQAAGCEIRYDGAWRVPARPAAPCGGTTIDNEARAAIEALLAALNAAGVIPPA